MDSQNQKVLKWLERDSITPREAALHLDIWRLAARIYDLRDSGHRIRTDMQTSEHGIRYAQYSLEQDGA